MAEQALIPTIERPLHGEGQDLPLRMDELADVRMLNSQLVRCGIRNCSRVERYLEILDGVMATTQDERIKVAGASVAVNALRACVSALKKDVQQLTNVQVNVQNGLDLSKLTVEQLKALAGE